MSNLFFNRGAGQLGLHLPQKLTIDNFAGGGGASTGMAWATGQPVDIAINHKPTALGMHRLNHGETQHYCESVWDIDPDAVCRGLPVERAWFSPDCRHFSKAKGAAPVKKEIRGLAWVLIRWALLKRPEVNYLENVQEFKTWGPLDENNRPIKALAGQTFEAFERILTTGISKNHPGYLECLDVLGIEKGTQQAKALADGLRYDVEFNALKACDYGAPTTRERLFMVARSDGYPVAWPDKTHGDPRSLEVQAGHLKPWRTAAECIDWSIPVKSIFGRPKPLAEATERRIAAGLLKYVIQAENPFVVPAGAQVRFMNGHGVMEPDYVISPFLTECANASNHRNMPIDEPLRTITAYPRGGAFALVSPVLKLLNEKTADVPLGAIAADSGGKSALVAAFLVKHYGGNYRGLGVGLDSPIHTITTTDHHALVASYLVKLRGTCRHGQAVTDPIPTITAGGNHLGEVRAFLVKYYGEGGQWSGLDEPMHTIPTKDRMALVVIKGDLYQIVDIGMRMLQPHELYMAQGFPQEYRHDCYMTPSGQILPLSKAEQVSMVGNSVSPYVSRALVLANEASKAKAMARRASA